MGAKKPRRDRGDGCVYRLQDGSWRGYVSLGRGPDGKPRRRWARARTKTALLVKLAEIRDAVARDELPATRRVTVARYLQEWLENITGSIEHITWSGYETKCRRHIIPRIGHVLLTELTALTIQHLYRDLATDGAGPVLIRKVHITLHKALKQAVLYGLLRHNPADAAQPPKGPHRETISVTAEVARMMLDALQKDALWPCFHLAMLTGLREGEIRALVWQDVDLERGILSVRRALSHHGTIKSMGAELNAKAKGTKRHASVRAVPLVPSLVDTLRTHRATQDRQRLAAGPSWHEHGLVFARGDGLPFRGEYLLKHLHQALDAVQLPRVRFHDLRHIVATLLAEDGVDLHIISGLLGHSSLEVTNLHYAHKTMRAKRNTLERLERILGDR